MAEISRSDVREFFLTRDMIPVGGAPEVLGEALKTEIVCWAKVMKDVGIAPE